MLTEDDYDNFSEVFDDTDYEDDELDSFLEFNGEEEELRNDDFSDDDDFDDDFDLSEESDDESDDE